MREASQGKQADQSEVNAAIGRSTRYFIPALIFIFTVNLPSALGLYWFVSGLVAFMQQSRILKQDETELETIADTPTKKDVIEGEVVDAKPKPKKKKPSKSTKRRKR